MPSAGTAHVAITPGGVIAGDPAVLAELCARRGPAVLAFVDEVCDPAHQVRAAADAFARFRAEVADGPLDLHPDTLLMRTTRRAVLELAAPGPDLGCTPARPLLCARAERSIGPADADRLSNHLRICEFCRGLARRVAAGEAAYREAEERPVPTDAAAAIVAAMAAAAPLHAEPAEPRFNGHAPARPPEVEPRVEKPEPRVEQPEPRVEETPAEETDERELVAAGPRFEAIEAEVAEEPDPEPAVVADVPARPVKPYYELPPVPTRRRRREWNVSARVGAVAGAAAALTRRARDTAERVLERPSPPGPVPVDEAPPSPPAPAVEPWTPADEVAFVEEAAPAPEPEFEPEPEPEASLVPAEPVVAEPVAPAAPRRRRERSEPPRLARPRRERRHHRPLRDHSPSELAMPTALVVAAIAVILAVAGVFGGESTDGPKVRQVRVSQPSPARLASVPPSASATSVSLERAAVVTGTQVATASAVPPVVTTSP